MSYFGCKHVYMLGTHHAAKFSCSPQEVPGIYNSSSLPPPPPLHRRPTLPTLCFSTISRRLVLVSPQPLQLTCISPQPRKCACISAPPAHAQATVTAIYHGTSSGIYGYLSSRGEGERALRVGSRCVSVVYDTQRQSKSLDLLFGDADHAIRSFLALQVNYNRKHAPCLAAPVPSIAMPCLLFVSTQGLLSGVINQTQIGIFLLGL